MTIVNAKYRFRRPHNSVIGFGRTNRPSTDAVGALHRWKEMRADRGFKLVVDDDDFLDAELLCDAKDADAANQLDALCREFGVERSPLG